MFATDIYGPAELPPTLDRWTIDLDAGKVIEERLDDRPQEFPRVDDRVVGRHHRYGYTTHFGVDDDGIHLGGLVKHDLQAGTTERARLRSRHATPAKACSCRPADDAGEDEGWLLSRRLRRGA